MRVGWEGGGVSKVAMDQRWEEGGKGQLAMDKSWEKGGVRQKSWEEGGKSQLAHTTQTQKRMEKSHEEEAERLFGTQRAQVESRAAAEQRQAI